MRFAAISTTASSALGLLGVLALFAGAEAAPTRLKTVQTYRGETASGAFIVQFKENRTESRQAWATRLGERCTGNWDSINGLASELDEDELNELRASPNVASIAEDGIMTIRATQNDATWGLSRISSAARLANQNAAARNFQFTFDDSAGEGVDIYVVDTGVLTTHNQFGGRAKAGPAFVNGRRQAVSVDGNGHGTHCAGTAAGTSFGVAKKANVIGVQVMSPNGSGRTSDIVSGLGWVLQEVGRTRRPSVVSMSLGGGAAAALDAAVARLTAAGVHVVVAAGNDNIDARNDSPARAPSAITVAATNIRDAKASFSSFGSVVDIWAPGQAVISSSIGSNSATASLSGTSMATPHVSGVVAYLIARDGNISPAAMAAKLKSLSLKNVISGVPRGTVNELVHIDR